MALVALQCWGYAAGIFGGLGAATLFGIGQTFHWFRARVLPNTCTRPSFGWRAGGVFVGVLLTPATPIAVLETFYTRVRPFGFWQPVRAHCAAAPQIASLPMAAINVVAGVFALIASFLSVFFLIGHYFSYFGSAIGVVLLCASSSIIVVQVIAHHVCGAMIAIWEGYRSERFVLEGRDCILVQPDIPMRSSAWIWRTEFFGAFPALDLALLEAGFRVAYIDVQNMYGAPMRCVHGSVLCPNGRNVRTVATCVLEGFSRARCMR